MQNFASIKKMSLNRKKKKNSLEFFVYKDELSESDYQEDSDGLEIDECPNPPKKKSLPTLDSNETAVLETIDTEIDKQLNEKATNTNMSVQNVKNILKHIITNEQVLAFVRNSANDEPFRTENLTFEPKLTRAKVKELFKNQAAPLRTNKSEVHILIDQELLEDEEDDEYIPGEDESDDDDSTLGSDLDSQPETPATPSTSYFTYCDTQTSWTDDGIFNVSKVFKLPPVSTPESSQENISLRTRSKLSLGDTPLEYIELAFIPPDITTDMYDIDCDDEDWKNFLEELALPLQAVTTATIEDDDEADPEYNILADEEIDAVDYKEELRTDRGVKVTNRELNALIAELGDFSDFFASPSPNDESRENDFETQTTVEENTPQNDNQRSSSTQNNVTEETSPPIMIEYPAVYSPFTVISEQQILLLEQQLRQHVQLLTQNFMQSCKHPIYNHFAEEVKEMVAEIALKANKNPKSCLKSLNLRNALKLMKYWEDKMSSNDDETQEMMKFVETQLRKFTTNKKLNKTFYPKLSPLLLKTTAKSDVFMYPSLLPRVPFVPVVYVPVKHNKIRYTLSEDSLIAIGLEQFISYLHSEKLILKNGKASLVDACQLIVRFLMPPKDFMSLHGHVLSLKNRRKNTDNPINYYFKHKMAPTTTHYVVPMNQNIPVNKQNKEVLYEPWKSFVYPETKLSSLDQIKPSNNSIQLILYQL